MLGAQVNYIKKIEKKQQKGTKSKKEKREEKRERKKHIYPDFINKSIPLHMCSNRVGILMRGLKLE